MSAQKKLRVFAGPNGSGKTTIIKELTEKKIVFGIYINADDIEQLLNQNGFLALGDYKITLTTEEVQLFFKHSTFAPKKLNAPDLWQHFSVSDNNLVVDPLIKINAYIAADIAELLRQTLLNNSSRFSYETVMSHSGKLDFLRKAKDAGYRIYLYYIATEDPQINVNRVKVRVAQNGHDVNPEVITARYYRSLENLKQAVLLSDRAYIFDNSGSLNFLIAEITDGKNVEIVDPENVPNWVMKYLLE